MKRLLLSLGLVGVVAVGAAPAPAQVVVRVPFVRVETGGPFGGTYVRAPFVRIYSPGPRRSAAPRCPPPRNAGWGARAPSNTPPRAASSCASNSTARARRSSHADLGKPRGESASPGDRKLPIPGARGLALGLVPPVPTR